MSLTAIHEAVTLQTLIEDEASPAEESGAKRRVTAVCG
jgi:hypothetical protein